MAVQIQSFQRVIPMIYAYQTPGIPYHEGWTKIGYTEKQDVRRRIEQQTHTAGIRWELCWMDNAMYKDGSGQYFTDHEFHDYLEGVKKVSREPGTEWFQIGGDDSQRLFQRFASRRAEKPVDGSTYQLRQEQQEAVAKTKAYFKNGGTEFLWNAKPRFGKTLSAYDLVVQMGFTNVLIVTNRPSIANSWADDFRKFIGWQHELAFVSDTDALKGKPGVLSREGFIDMADQYDGMVAFESLQGLKGSVYFGGEYDKLKWMAKEVRDASGKVQRGITFDLLIIDESHEGVDTAKTDRAFRNIDRKHTLYLSGTPFKALAGGRFSEKQIYNWSYADEQEAKETWTGEDYNPYEALPRLSMYTYQLGNMIYEQVRKGLDLSGEDGSVDYAFDLNEFFATNDNGRFIHEEEIRKFLHALSTQEKYPFSTPELRAELSHTLWILNRVASAKALAKLLKTDPVFAEYEVVLAAGDGQLDDDVEVNDKAFDRVKDAIANYDKTITLSVGQLTVGVTIPEWSGVLMLCNLQSPSSYMQAAFRAQNPCILTRNGQRYRKETAYVFDFDPARTLIIFDEFANNLSPDMVAGRGTSEERRQNIKRLLNFFPVLGEDEEGRMVELDAAQVLSIPRKLKSVEVVRRGFMSNFLFQNIGAVFGAPSIVTEIVKKLNPAQEEKLKRNPDSLDHAADIAVDEDGNVEIPSEIVIGKTQDLFGEKIYEDIAQAIAPAVDRVAEEPLDYGQTKRQVQTVVDTVKDTLKQKVIAPVIDSYGAKKSTQNRLEREVATEIDRAFERLQGDYEQQVNIARMEHEKKREAAATPEQVQAADKGYQDEMNAAMQSFMQSMQAQVEETIQQKPQELVEKLERHKAEEEKRSIEDDVRARLRGFSRTIPSFIMAYGDGYLTLQNFDEYTEDEVFLEVTGITEDDFRFLRDGGDYTDENGEIRHFEGHLFDEVVFNDSVNEFWQKKQELANYFDESSDEDIFDYIPPQKTNQIFTPRWVVKKMVDELEAENPGCFDDSDKTFADLYMKSGLYITEIVKRLYRSERMKAYFPDDETRIRHILTKQVYGMAPTRIIYLIATNYILGFNDRMRVETKNFVQADAAEASKTGTLEQLVNQYFG
ncbi:restriction endonuclease [Enterocloster bolteae]|jgi:type II restriction enzyme|uniref:DEAD/DEAH box helicase family protein n=1 Tax=Enterocloster bolteae TaxID=208479 RepID=UPI001D15C8A9|nr:DEAD/DEAH box helicase family protein [Enterocloster bolteae]MCC3389963.1 restriction endonuclease [Enterocloster bolteae]